MHLQTSFVFFGVVLLFCDVCSGNGAPNGCYRIADGHSCETSDSSTGGAYDPSRRQTGGGSSEESGSPDGHGSYDNDQIASVSRQDCCLMINSGAQLNPSGGDVSVISYNSTNDEDGWCPMYRMPDRRSSYVALRRSSVQFFCANGSMPIAIAERSSEGKLPSVSSDPTRTHTWVPLDANIYMMYLWSYTGGVVNVSNNTGTQPYGVVRLFCVSFSVSADGGGLYHLSRTTSLASCLSTRTCNPMNGVTTFDRQETLTLPAPTHSSPVVYFYARCHNSDHYVIIEVFSGTQLRSFCKRSNHVYASYNNRETCDGNVTQMPMASGYIKVTIALRTQQARLVVSCSESAVTTAASSTTSRNQVPHTNPFSGGASTVEALHTSVSDSRTSHVSDLISDLTTATTFIVDYQKVESEKAGTSVAVPVVVSILVLLAIIAAIIVAFLLIRKRRRNSKKSDEYTYSDATAPPTAVITTPQQHSNPTYTHTTVATDNVYSDSTVASTDEANKVTGQSNPACNSINDKGTAQHTAAPNGDVYTEPTHKLEHSRIDDNEDDDEGEVVMTDNDMYTSTSPDEKGQDNGQYDDVIQPQDRYDHTNSVYIENNDLYAASRT